MKLIITHKHADVDAFACAYVFYVLFQKNAILLFPNGVNKQVKKLIDNLKLDVKYLTDISMIKDLENIEEIIIVDTANFSQIPNFESIIKLNKNITVYDHHVHEKDKIKLQNNVKLYLFDTPSLSEAIYNLFKDKINDKVCLILLACGILTDTKYLSLANENTIKVFNEILSKINLSKEDLIKLLRVGQDYSKKVAIAKAIKRSKFYIVDNNYIISLTHSSSYESDIANLLLCSCSDFSIVLSVKEKERCLRIIIRSRKSFPYFTAYEFTKILESKLGGSGGGHLHASVLEIKFNNKIKKKKIIEEYLEKVERCLKDALGTYSRTYKELII